MRKYLLPLIATAGLASASSAFAATASGTFNVKVNITTACAVSATAVNFGSLSTVLGTETANSTVSVICNPGTAYSLSFVSGSAGLTATGNLLNGPATIGATYDLGNTCCCFGHRRRHRYFEGWLECRFLPSNWPLSGYANGLRELLRTVEAAKNGLTCKYEVDCPGMNSPGAITLKLCQFKGICYENQGWDLRSQSGSDSSSARHADVKFCRYIASKSNQY